MKQYAAWGHALWGCILGVHSPLCGTSASELVVSGLCPIVMPHRLLPLLVLLFAAGVHAQAPDSVAWSRFWPPAVGDVYEYRLTCNTPGQGCPIYPVLTRYQAIAVTDEGGRRRTVFDVQRSGQTSTCELIIGDADLWFTGTCGFVGPPTGDFTRSVVQQPQTVNIGGHSYVLPAVRSFGIAGNSSQAFGADVGLLSYTQFGGGSAWTRRSLTYAVIGGVVYGQTSVTAEPEPSGEGVTLTVRPSPARTSTVVRLTLPSSRSVRVAAHDVLGRELVVLHDGPLAAGEHRLTLNVDTFPAGVYVVRAAGEGWAANARAVVVSPDAR